MNKYTVINQVVNFNAGLLELEDGQSRPRAHKLQHIKGKTFEIVYPVQFKVGEVIGYEGELPRSIVGNLEIVEEKPKRKKQDDLTDDGV